MNLNQNQQFLHSALLRRNGLRTAIALGNPYESELTRIQAAVEDIESRMTDQEQAEYYAQLNPVLTPREQAALARKLETQMAENRDRPSI